MKPKLAVIYAAHLQEDPLLAAVARVWPGAAWYAAHDVAQASAMARTAAEVGATHVLSAGGDGQLSGVASGLLAREQPPVLGVLPLGTANDFARGAQIDSEALRDDVATMMAWPERMVDLAQVNGHAYLNSLSLGMGAEATQQAPRLMKGLLGGAAYTLSGIATAISWSTWHVRITCDHGEWAGDAVHIVVANGRYAAGGFDVAPRARLDDGLLDVAVYSASQAEALIEHVPRVLSGAAAGQAAQEAWRTSACRIKAEPALPVSIDGESESWQELDIGVLPRRLRMLLPPAAGPLFTVRP